MDVLNFRLTEISLELLGNQFFDIFGRKCDTLGSLYRSKSGPATDKFAANSDLVAALKVKDIFSFNDDEPEETHGGDVINDNSKNDQISGESSDESDEVDDEPGYIDNRDQNQSADFKITQIMNDVDQGEERKYFELDVGAHFTATFFFLFHIVSEYRRLLINSDSAKMKYFITNKHRLETEYEDEYEICNRFHRQENDELLGQSDAFIKLIKHIKCDSRNSLKMGEIAATILKVKDHFISNPASRP